MSGLDMDKITDAAYENAPVYSDVEMDQVERMVVEVGNQIAEKLLAWPADSSVPVGVVASLVREWTGGTTE